MKARIRKTGEIVDVIAHSASIERDDIRDYVRYIDSKGVEHPYEPLNYYWDLEEVDTTPNERIDWEQRRYEIAKSTLQGFCSNSTFKTFEGKELAEWSVEIADALIGELKKKEQ